MKMYVFERDDGTRYVKQFKLFSEAEAHATAENVTIVERR